MWLDMIPIITLVWPSVWLRSPWRACPLRTNIRQPPHRTRSIATALARRVGPCNSVELTLRNWNLIPIFFWEKAGSVRCNEPGCNLDITQHYLNAMDQFTGLVLIEILMKRCQYYPGAVGLLRLMVAVLSWVKHLCFPFRPMEPEAPPADDLLS